MTGNTDENEAFTLDRKVLDQMMMDGASTLLKGNQPKEEEKTEASTTQ